MSEAPATPAPANYVSVYGKWRSTYLVVLAVATMAVAVIDRAVMSLMVRPVSEALGLSDIQMSLVGGLAFSLFYAFCAIPMGRLIDSWNRPWVLAIGMLLWSVATVGTGLATGFAMLFLMRMSVAVGEASASPCSVGMVSDVFMGVGLGRMVAVVMLGATFGSSIALWGGSFILDVLDGRDTIIFGMAFAPWQMVFFWAALPGLILAPLIALTVRDPERRRVLLNKDGTRVKPSFKALVQFIKDHPGAVAAHALGYAVWSISDKSLDFWGPTYLARAHDLDTSESGYMFGTIKFITTVGGNFIVGWMVDRAMRSGRLDATLRIGRTAAALGVIPVVLMPFMPTSFLGIGALTLGLLFNAGYTTVTIAQAQLAPNQVRAQYVGMYLLVSNIVAGVIGTSLVAVFTELVFRDRAMIGYSIAIVCGGASIAGSLILTFGSKPFARSMEKIGKASVDGGAVAAAPAAVGQEAVKA